MHDLRGMKRIVSGVMQGFRSIKSNIYLKIFFNENKLAFVSWMCSRKNSNCFNARKGIAYKNISHSVMKNLNY